ncbi:response regulator transcription factor [Streptomyces rimosus]|uniref:response regulator transcription factor n=1 Tax=Streptomyces rimosus TaxID=1927 RepID=UPI0037D3618A
MSDFGTPMPGPARAAGEPHWKPSLGKVGRLTPRERETFLLLAEGLSNESMARRLYVTERTVRAHVAAVMAKLELDSRLAACLASYAFALHSCTGRCPGMLAASHS